MLHKVFEDGYGERETFRSVLYLVTGVLMMFALSLILVKNYPWKLFSKNSLSTMA